MTIGCKISETVKGKLSLGARILQLGGVKRVFKQTSTRREAVEDFPMLFINSWPYRWPPLRGLHFPVRDQSNSILQIANWLNSIQGKLHIKFSIYINFFLLLCLLTSKQNFCFVQTSIPLRKIKRADKSENMTKPSQKYMEIVTVDNFNFWFMGFLNYQKAFNCLQQALSQSQMWFKHKYFFSSASSDVFT